MANYMDSEFRSARRADSMRMAARKWTPPSPAWSGWSQARALGTGVCDETLPSHGHCFEIASHRVGSFGSTFLASCLYVGGLHPLETRS